MNTAPKLSPRDKLKELLSSAYHHGRNSFHFNTGDQAEKFLAALAPPGGEGVDSAEHKLAAAGVFAGHRGLRGLAEHDAFWEKQAYGTRLYYGDGGADYLHRGVLRAAVAILDNTTPQSASGDCLICPDCGSKALMYECVACSHTNYPTPPPASQERGGDELHVFNCRSCPVSIEARWSPPDCPECGNPCELDHSAKPSSIRYWRGHSPQHGVLHIEEYEAPASPPSSAASLGRGGGVFLSDEEAESITADIDDAAEQAKPDGEAALDRAFASIPVRTTADLCRTLDAIEAEQAKPDLGLVEKEDKPICRCPHNWVPVPGKAGFDYCTACGTSRRVATHALGTSSVVNHGSQESSHNEQAQAGELHQSAEQLAQWLEAKYRRHGEDEDRQAAALLRRLAGGVTVDDALAYEAITARNRHLNVHPGDALGAMRAALVAALGAK